MQFYSRREWPSTSAPAPDGVDGWDTGTAAFGEWERHLNRALLELAVHDLAQQLAELEERLQRHNTHLDDGVIVIDPEIGALHDTHRRLGDSVGEGDRRHRGRPGVAELRVGRRRTR